MHIKGSETEDHISILRQCSEKCGHRGILDYNWSVFSQLMRMLLRRLILPDVDAQISF